MQKRICWIDILRGIGILSIVFSHTLQNTGITSKILYTFHVPLFFFVSGLLYNDGKTPFPVLIGKKARRVLVPYFIWGMISLFLFLTLGKFAEQVLKSGRETTLKTGLLELMQGYSDGNSPLWFLPAMFLSSVLLRCADGAVRAVKNTYAQCAVKALPLVLSVSLAYVFQSRGYNHEIWSIDDVVILFFFSWSGYLSKDAFTRIRPDRRLLLSVGAVLFAGACVMGAFVNGRILYLTGIYHSLPLFYLNASAAILGLCMISQGIGRFRALEYIGKNTLPILVMHKFPVMFFQCVCPFIKDYWAQRSMPVMLLITVLSVAMSCATGEVIRRYLPVLLGESRKN